MSTQAKFALENGAGSRFDFSISSGAIFANVSGFGTELMPSYANLRDGFFTVISDVEPQSDVRGDIKFISDAYGRYTAFVDWIIAAKRLYFLYTPQGSEEYRAEVRVNFISKTYMKTSGVLICPISFSRLTPWYLPINLKINMTSQDTDALKFPFTFNDTIVFGSSSAGTMSADISPGGHIPAAIYFEYTGAISVPTLTLTGKTSGVIYGKCVINAAISSGETIEISSEYRNSRVEKITAAGERVDMMGYVDISYNPFPRVPLAETCTLTLTAADAISGSGNGDVFYYYKGV